MATQICHIGELGTLRIGEHEGSSGKPELGVILFDRSRGYSAVELARVFENVLPITISWAEMEAA